MLHELASANEVYPLRFDLVPLAAIVLLQLQVRVPTEPIRRLFLGQLPRLFRKTGKPFEATPLQVRVAVFLEGKGLADLEYAHLGLVKHDLPVEVRLL